MRIPFRFSSIKTEAKRKAFCIAYTKEYCMPSVSDEILPDSTILSCNKTLKSGSSIYNANSNILTYSGLDQYISMPETIYSKYDGIYQINLIDLDFNSADLATPYIFTLQIKTNKGTYSDTTQLTFQP